MAGWKSVDEIEAYRLSVALRDRIIALTAKGVFNRDFTLLGQIRDSSASAPSNLSEGFQRYFHGEFGYLTSVAKGSLGETINHLHDAAARRYIDKDEHSSLIELATKALKATSGLLRYLRSSEAPGDNRRRKRKPKRPRN